MTDWDLKYSWTYSANLMGVIRSQLGLPRSINEVGFQGNNNNNNNRVRSMFFDLHCAIVSLGCTSNRPTMIRNDRPKQERVDAQSTLIVISNNNAKPTLGDTTTNLDSVDKGKTVSRELNTRSVEADLLDSVSLANLLVVLTDINGVEAGSEGTEERDLNKVGVVLVVGGDVGREVEERSNGSSSNGALHGSLGDLLELADIIRVAGQGAGGSKDETTAGDLLIGDKSQSGAKRFVDGGVGGDRAEGRDEVLRDGGVNGDNGIELGARGEVTCSSRDDGGEGEGHWGWNEEGGVEEWRRKSEKKAELL